MCDKTLFRSSISSKFGREDENIFRENNQLE